MIFPQNICILKKSSRLASLGLEMQMKCRPANALIWLFQSQLPFIISTISLDLVRNETICIQCLRHVGTTTLNIRYFSISNLQKRSKFYFQPPPYYFFSISHLHPTFFIIVLRGMSGNLPDIPRTISRVVSRHCDSWTFCLCCPSIFNNSFVPTWRDHSKRVILQHTNR